MVPDKQAFKRDGQRVLCDMISWKGNGWDLLNPSIQNSRNVLKNDLLTAIQSSGCSVFTVGGFHKCYALCVGVFVLARYESCWFQAVSGGELIGELANKRALLSLRICTIHRTWLETSNEYNKRSCRFFDFLFLLWFWDVSFQFRPNLKWYFSKDNPISRKWKAK